MGWPGLGWWEEEKEGGGRGMGVVGGGHYSQEVRQAMKAPGRPGPFVCAGDKAIRHVKLVLSSAALSAQH